MFSLVNVPNKIPLTCITDDVLFPGSAMKIPITTIPNINLVNKYLMSQTENAMSRTVIGVLPYKGSDLRSTENCIGTAALVLQVIGTNWPKHSFVLYVVGLRRIRVQKIVAEEPYPMAVVTPLNEGIDLEESKEELSTLLEEFKKSAARLMDVLDLFHPLMGKMKKIVDTMPDSSLVDACAAMVASTYTEKLDMLNTPELTERLKKIIPLLKRQIEGLEPKKGNIIPKKGLPIIKLFRSRLPATDSLITDLEEGDDMAELHEKLKKANLPAYAHKVAFKEFQRLKRMGPFSPEHGVIRSYVELMSELPWSISSKETIDICKAKKDLDADHYGMEKLKRRVLEYLAVRQLKNKLRGPILCFVGPPGVGKTSIGRSIAHTLGREFHRISLGGVCNQSDIRGHRRTYVGALPGRIIQGLKTVGVNNPVMLLDEIDKMGASSHGDPGAALLEVLDPEQNCHFVDHYLNVPFDLSQVTFIATANRINTVPPALLDRMEVIHVSGYTQEEKFHIAQRHLLPKQLQQHGLDNDVMILPDDSLKKIIRAYTREAGVRTLERKLAALCRSVAVKVAEAQREDTRKDLPIMINEKDLEDKLGPVVYEGEELWCRVGVPGIAVGLAWSSVGGEVMLVEASKMAGGSGELVLTGHLGSVMKESATLALNWVRTVANLYGLLHERGEDLMSETDVHIHFPAGAVCKDGPSAGVTIATALISLFTSLPIASDVALTGEITLRGVVLPVGGIKEKVLAAHRAGLTRVILPKKCEKDLLEIPQNILSEMTMIFVNHMSEVLHAAFNGELTPIKHCNTSITSKL